MDTRTRISPAASRQMLGGTKQVTKVTCARAAQGRPFPARQAGVSMVEFLIVGPVAMVLVLALIQLGLMYSAKQVLNEAVFAAARAGATQNASVSAMKSELAAAVVPLYQDSTESNATLRISKARVIAQADLLVPWLNWQFDVLNPTPDVFKDFGVTNAKHVTYIPNDNLEYRDYKVKGKKTGMSLQDANALKIRVTYAYELKVPLMKLVFKSVMCAVDTGVNGFGRGSVLPQAGISNCARYYLRGRVPIVADATVQMQTPAQQ
jgi:hypothetical protein